MSEKERFEVRKAGARGRLLYELRCMERACVELRESLVRPGDLGEDELKRMGWQIWKKQCVIGELLKKLCEQGRSKGDEREEGV